MASPLNEPEFEQAPGDGEGQGSLACCSPWGRKESDTTERLKNSNSHTRTEMFTKPMLYNVIVLC